MPSERFFCGLARGLLSRASVVSSSCAPLCVHEEAPPASSKNYTLFTHVFEGKMDAWAPGRSQRVNWRACRRKGSFVAFWGGFWAASAWWILAVRLYGSTRRHPPQAAKIKFCIGIFLSFEHKQSNHSRIGGLPVITNNFFTGLVFCIYSGAA